MDIDTYCSRIGYVGPRTPKLEVLQALALRHPQAIPFENVSVVAGGVPDLSIDALQAKLVRGGRGGYCAERQSLKVVGHSIHRSSLSIVLVGR